jgi:hypothetical protein
LFNFSQLLFVELNELAGFLVHQWDRRRLCFQQPDDFRRRESVFAIGDDRGSSGSASPFGRIRGATS